MATKKIDWTAVRTAYLAARAKGDKTPLVKVADKFGLNYGTVKNHAAKHKWNEEADGLLEEVEAAVHEQIKAKIVPKLVSRRLKAIEEQVEYVDFLKKKAIIALSGDNVTLTTNTAVTALVKALEMEQKIHDRLHDEYAKPQGDDLVTRFNAFVEKLASSGAPKAEAAA